MDRQTKILLAVLALGALALWNREKIVAAVVETLEGWKAAKNAAKYLPLLNATESKYGIPRDLLARVAYQESHFRDDIVSGKLASVAGALGIMQIVPRWHPDVNPLSVPAAIDYAGKYLRSLYLQFGTWKQALAAYNWGPGNQVKDRADGIIGDDWPTETKNYVAQITKDVPVV